jgi:hypothetical protein
MGLTAGNCPSCIGIKFTKLVHSVPAYINISFTVFSVSFKVDLLGENTEEAEVNDFLALLCFMIP